MSVQKNHSQKFKVLNIVLWIGQFLLGSLFIMAGFMKIVTPIEELATQVVWPGDVSPGLVRFIGVSEFLGGLGLLLPAILKIKPMLTPLAALGLAVVMVLAAIFHLVRREMDPIGMNLLLAAVALFIAWGRGKKVPILSKLSKI